VKLRQVIALLFLASLVSCGRFPAKGLDLPPTPVLSGGPGWAVVKSSYVRLKDAPTASASDLAALRDGTLVEIVGREFDSKGGSLWYELRLPEMEKGAAERLQGWVPESELDCFATREQAERALVARPKAKS
jgi:hypothetical protein